MLILLQSIFIPILLSPIVYLLAKRIGPKAGLLTFGILLYSTSLLLYIGSLGTEYVESYFWGPIGTFGLRVDGLSFPFAAIIYILSTTLAIYSIPYMKHRIEAVSYTHLTLPTNREV